MLIRPCFIMSTYVDTESELKWITLSRARPLSILEVLL